MRIHLDKIGPEGFTLDEPLTREWLDEALGPRAIYRAAGPGRLQVRLERVEDVVHARGQVSVDLEAACSRCLSPTRLALSTRFQVSLFPRGSEPAAADDGELGADDMGVASYEHKEIDLSAIVRDEVFLELPMSPLCTDDCAGLCPQCGANLNERACGCAPQADPRWQALGRLRAD